MKDKKKSDTQPSLRKKGEIALQHQAHPLKGPKSLDMQRLSHELELQKTALEMQNEALRISRQEGEDSLNVYTGLYDFAPVGYFILDKDGLIVKANLVGARTFNLERSQLIGRHFDLLISPDSRQQFKSFRHAVPVADTELTCEVNIPADNKTCIYVQVKGTALRSSDQIQIAVIDITDHKRAEETIRLNEARLESLLKISQYKANDVHDLLKFVLEEAIRLTDSKFGYIYHYNEQRREFTLNNWSSNVMKECSIAEQQTIYQLDKTGIWGEAVRQGRPIIMNNFQAPNPLKKGYPDGHALLYKYMTIPVIIDNAIVGVIGLANKSEDYDEADVRQMTLLMDSAWKIVDRKRAEEALRESEEALKRAQEIAHLGSWELDLKNNRLSWSDEVYRIFGLQPQEFAATYEAFLERVHPDDRAAVDAAYSGSLREGRDTYDIEHRVVRKLTGEVRIVHEKCEHVRDEDGRLIRSVGMVHDITEQKRAQKALRTISDRSQSYVELTGQLVWTTNADGEVVEDMPSWRNYTGQTYEEIKGRGWSNALHPDDLEHTLQVWKKAVMEKSNYETEYRILRQDGTYRHFMVRGIPVLEKDRSIREWVGTCIDITERKAAEEAIKIANQKLQAAYNEMESFSYSISHDLRAPLRHMSGFVQMLQKRIVDYPDKKTHDYATRIAKAAKKMGMLIDDLLAFARIGRSEMNITRVNLNTIVRDTVREIQADADGRNITWEIDELPNIYGDQAMLKLVLVNLISNAVKYTSIRSQAKIGIRCKNEGDEFVFSVKDNGVGFNMDYVDKLFGVFQRLHTEEEFEGTGIGLANVLRIISRHGGRTWAEGAEGQGATFYFTLSKIKEI